jgi:hypothetical protein
LPDAAGRISISCRRIGKDPGEISRTLPLAFLAPDIVEAILEGKQPIDLTPFRLTRSESFPHRWGDQRRTLGFASRKSNANGPQQVKRMSWERPAGDEVPNGAG